MLRHHADKFSYPLLSLATHQSCESLIRTVSTVSKYINTYIHPPYPETTVAQDKNTRIFFSSFASASCIAYRYTRRYSFLYRAVRVATRQLSLPSCRCWVQNLARHKTAEARASVPLPQARHKRRMGWHGRLAPAWTSIKVYCSHA